MANSFFDPAAWSAYHGSHLRFEPELDLFLVRREARIYFARTIHDAKIIAKCLEILNDPELEAVRLGVKEGLAAFAASSIRSNDTKH